MWAIYFPPRQPVAKRKDPRASDLRSLHPSARSGIEIATVDMPTSYLRVYSYVPRPFFAWLSMVGAYLTVAVISRCGWARVPGSKNTLGTQSSCMRGQPIRACIAAVRGRYASQAAAAANRLDCNRLMPIKRRCTRYGFSIRGREEGCSTARERLRPLPSIDRLSRAGSC